jgi:hypothetical protein
MNSFDFPVFVHDKDDDSVTEFLTFTSMQRELDKADVANGGYRAWDARGRCLKLSLSNRKSEWLQWEWLKIRLSGGQVSQEDFAALKNRAEKCPECEPLSKRFLRRIAKAEWRKID